MNYKTLALTISLFTIFSTNAYGDDVEIYDDCTYTPGTVLDATTNCSISGVGDYGDMSLSECLDLCYQYTGHFTGDHGCTDPTALNYNDTATVDDGTCDFGPLLEPEEQNHDEDGACYVSTRFNTSCVENTGNQCQNIPNFAKGVVSVLFLPGDTCPIDDDLNAGDDEENDDPDTGGDLNAGDEGTSDAPEADEDGASDDPADDGMF